ncbi:MAG: NERD domain-containing protein [Melioribacteraceae bacterium]|nr:NERD domain-containing protein [Melioribacteraceae bacterium]
MAIIYPNVKNISGPQSERKFLRKLKEQLSDEYWVFHSVEFISNIKGTLQQGEADFIILHPELGILVLEVKGGKEIDYDGHTNTMYSTDEFGNKHKLKSEPMAQGRKNMHALIDNLINNGIYISREHINFTYGNVAVFPGVEFNLLVMPPNYSREIIVDSNDLDNLESKLGSIYHYWARKNTSSAMITRDKLELIRDKVLAPIFQLHRSFKVSLKDEEEVFVRLTEKQKNVFDKMSKRNKRAVIEGFAGTGKTIIASIKARELAENGTKTLLLCYNNNLADYLKSQLENVDVFTFHSLARKIITESNPQKWPENPNQDFWENEIVYTLMECDLKKYSYSAILVDEAQDFNSEWWEFIKLLMVEDSYFYIFFDPNQNVRNTLIKLPISSTIIPLDENCRNTKNINQVVKKYGKVEILEFEENYDGEDVELFTATTFEKLDEIIKILLTRLRDEYKLTSKNFSIIHNFSDEDPYKMRMIQGRMHRKYSTSPPRSNEIIYDTINRFKGLEADALIIINHINHGTDYQMYVAASRAKHKLFIINFG